MMWYLWFVLGLAVGGLVVFRLSSVDFKRLVLRQAVAFEVVGEDEMAIEGENNYLEAQGWLFDKAREVPGVAQTLYALVPLKTTVVAVKKEE